jgi:hypothetical protein
MGAAMSVRAPSKEVREVIGLIEPLGYRFDRAGGGHLVYVHDVQPPLSLASTPSDHRWRDNVMADLRRRHPDEFKRRKSENRRSSSERAKDRARRQGRQVPALVQNGNNGNGHDVPVVEAIPNPGSPEAHAKGCRCSRVDNRNGVGVEGHDGVFQMRQGCPLHGAEVDALLKRLDKREPEAPAGPQCACGNPIESHPGPGRPRKWCQSCRPSTWRRSDEEARERARERWRAWYRRQKERVA